MKEKSIFERADGGLTAEQLAKRDAVRKRIRIVGLVFFLLAVAGITYLVLPFLKNVGKDGYFEKVQDTIDDYGTVGGPIVFVVIQALQVIVAVIPPVQVVGGLLYGWLFGALLSFAGIVLGALAVWGVVKLMGAPLVEAVVSEKHLKKFSFLEDERRLIFILIILYVIPGVPKDIITYLVPLTKVRLRDFLMYVMPFRLPAILLSTAFGSSAAKGNYGAAIAVVSAIAVIAVLGLMFREKILAKLGEHHHKSKMHKSDN
ncbi:Uncharacterized membrane protein YdjX, TVP38/TMEM64 family, SNARE-associated domain [Ruminococcus sp. YE71]|uniref:TVP38/TMEM64 family protein n=1 Tax=unclassified Ruminococcus TaxID=2608920 RepID=UPI0008818494|nr:MULTISPECIES: VTT domain-containing protein [unclassified Ruminococcus]SDA18686.1 Uncharacterized membrane protein YdjX, TVP38/TMEM64 family, SNARE-associated domain [Ruminococcus sp. YE78]SFW29473.1 Uncharacterized membrane protein YdjX, TVP38/TMEM64 family, SNARE-associated domain [Ruminococcus sp. YE71]